MFDLTPFSLSFQDAREQPLLPGLLACGSPRRCARGRDGDQLILLVSPAGGPLDPSIFEKLLPRISTAYFQAAGPVTTGLRAAAETLNQALLDRNLRAPAGVTPVAGILNLAVIHHGMLYLGHGGPAHSLLVSGEVVEHYFEPQPSSRGLGLSRNLTVRYYQHEVKPGDLLLLAPTAPPEWTPPALAGASQLEGAALAVRLLQISGDLAAAGVHLAEGSGRVGELHTLPTDGASPSPRPDGQAPESAPMVLAADLPQPAPDRPAEQSVQPPPLPPAVEPPPAPAPAPESIPFVAAETPVAPAIPSPRSTRPSRRPTPPGDVAETPIPPSPPVGSRLRPGFARLWHGGRKIRQRMGSATRSMVSSLLPGQNGQPGSLSSSSMVFIAIAIPLIVVTLATVVYFQRGRGEQYRETFARAQSAAAQAAAQTDSTAQRTGWETTLLLLDKADGYQTSSESSALREQAQAALDTLQGITRLSYQPAIVGGLASSVSVTQMVAAGNDLYLLDSASGRVIHAVMTSRGYEVDPAFRCEKGTFGSYKVGDILDIASLPKGNEFKATILALDANGNLLYCIPGEAPLSAPLAPPDSNWGKIAAITYDSGTLYILDPKVNAVWVYGGVSGTFSDRPQSFFDNDAPAMADVIDLAVNNTDLYLLHADGHLTVCTLSYTSAPTRCADPAPLTDPRPGRETVAPTFPDTHFSQILFTRPPDPSIYLLDPAQMSIYHFSMRLNLQRLLRGAGSGGVNLPAGPATAFAISQSRTAFLAFGSQVFYATVP